MRRIIGILVLLAAIGSQACGAEPQAIEEVQGALNNAVAPARPYGPQIPGNTPGYVTTNAPGGEIPLRPNLGFPGWVGVLTSYTPPSQCTQPFPFQICLTEGSGDPTYGPTGAIPANRVGYGYAEFWASANQYPYAGGIWNAWSNTVPLRTVTPGLPQTGPAYVVPSLQQTHMNDLPTGARLTYVVMDYYARLTLCSGTNLSGSCIQFGYNCTLGGGVCHGDIAGGAPVGHTLGVTDFQLDQGAAATILANTSSSLKIELGI